MRYWHSGITVWHGTSDAPAPVTAAPPAVPIPITMAVRPINPGNVVTVRYRVNTSAVQVMRARLIDTDYAANTQYFEAILPPAAVGSQIRFVAVCECNGRQAPDRTTVAKMPASFAITAGAPPIARRQMPTFTTLAKPPDLATARKLRRDLETQLQSARRQSTQTAQQLANRRRQFPKTDATITALTNQSRAQGTGIAQTLKNLRTLGDYIRELKPPPLDVNAPLTGVSDRLPVLLFPVRIETRFDTADALAPKLMVRIFPDQLAVDGHHNGLSTAELGDGQAWLVESSGATDEAQRAAWRKLATQYGSQRAAWIALRMTSTPSPVALGNDPIVPPPRVYILPDHFVITLYRGDAIAYQQATSRVDDQLAVLWDRQDIDGGSGELFDPGTRWMSNFTTASAVGMATTIKLVPTDLNAGFTRLTVVGVRTSAPGDASVVEEFVQHHHYTDGFAFIPPGTPTNNTAGTQSSYSESAPNADLNYDVERKQPLEGRDGRTNSERLASALGIGVGTFDFIEGERTSVWSRAAEMQQALWPATGEYMLRYMLPATMSIPTRAHLERHFCRFVRARGPLPLVRIGRQPYGVLPVSKLNGWEPSLKDLPAELTPATSVGLLQFHAKLHSMLMVFLADWIRLAAREDLVPRIGGESKDLDEQLLAVLGMSAGTTEVRTRPILDDRLVALMIPTLMNDVYLNRSTVEAYAAANEAMAAWVKSWDALKGSTVNKLKQLIQAAGLPNVSFESSPLMQAFGSNKLLPLSVPLVQPSGTNNLLAEMFTHGLKRARSASSVQAAINTLAAVPTDVLSGLLTDVFDLCSHRLDAWLTSLAYARLEAMRKERPTGVHVGAFGWVEDLRFQPPSDESAGYIHAPSVAHAGAAAVLRNAFLTHQGSAPENPFAINLASERVRRALELIDGVRKGQPLSVILGYQFERGLHDRRRDVHIAAFRAAFPLVANKDTPSVPTDAVEAVAARNVVDGLALATVWRGARGQQPVPAASFTLPPVNGVAAMVSDTGVIGELESLIDSLDSVGDVLLTESVFQTVQGNYERAGAALDALAGVAAPADLEAVRTPFPGVSLEHRVCVMFGASERLTPPTPPPGATPQSSAGPRALAEPRLAAWVGEMIGDTSAIECVVRYVAEGNGRKDTMTISLAELGLDAVDLMYASAFPVSGELTELERRIGHQVMSTVAVAANSRIEIDVRRGGTVSRSLGEAIEVGRRALELIGGAQSLTPDSLVLPEQAHIGPAFDNLSYSEFSGRVDNARTTLSGIITQAATKLAAAPDGARIDARESTAPTLSEWLLALSRFGIEGAIPDSPILAMEQRPRLKAAIDEAKLRLAKSALELQSAAAALTAPASASDDPEEPVAAPTSGQRYAKAIGLLNEGMKALFGGQFVSLPTFTVGTAAGLELRQAQSQAIGAGAPNERVLLWLQQAAQTHRAVARLEDVLLASEAWRTTVVPIDGPTAGPIREFAGSTRMLHVAQLPHDPDIKWLGLADAERDSSDRPRGRVSIVSLQQNALDTTGRLAGLVIERWQETIPGEDVTTGMSFHFDRPNSLAPQTMLLAVPHTLRDVGAEWRLSDLVEIVQDTAVLARVRLVDPDALHELDRLLPALILPQDPDRPGYAREIILPNVRQVAEHAATIGRS